MLRKGLVGFAWLLTVGCRGDRPRWQVTDTESRHFEVTCDEAKGCVGRPSADQKADSAFLVVGAGRVLGICPAGAKGDAEPRECRALLCRGEVDCPPPTGMTKGVCINGLCVEPSHAVSYEDAVMLCSAGTGPGKDNPKQVEAHALALQCGSPCRVPRNCRQP